MKNISIIGAGTMGNGIAHCFAQKGFNVYLVDLSLQSLEKAKLKIEKNLNRMINKSLISEQQKKDTIERILYQTKLDENVKKSDLVIEAATESKSIKLNIFKELDELCNTQTILASNTSSISISDIAKATNRPEKVIGMHFMNPVPIMKLVEVITGNTTSKETTNQIMELSKSLNKIPVLVNDAPGFVANRILMPMINEAIECLDQKVSGVKEIDTVMILGMSHPMGPLHLADFIGLDVCLSILNVMHDGFKNPKYKPNSLLEKMVSEGDLGIKSGQGFYKYEGREKHVSPRFENKNNV